MVFFETIQPTSVVTKNTLWICIIAFFIASVAGFYTAIETDMHVKTSGGAYTLQWGVAIGLLVCSIVGMIGAWLIPKTNAGLKALFAAAALFFLLVGAVFSGAMTFNSQVGGIYQNTSGACQPIAGSAVQFFTLVMGLILAIVLFVEMGLNVV